MKKTFFSLLVVSIALLLLLGAGLQDPGPVGAAGEEPGALETEAGGNPDGLEGPVETPAPKFFYPAAGGGLFPATALLSTAGAADENGNFAWDDPGSLKLNKAATPVEGTSNRWQITLTLEGKDLEVETTSDIVLVIDTSGSMTKTRMSAAKAAAKAFVNDLLEENSSTRIAVVTYATNVTVHHSTNPFKDYSEKSALISTIEGLGTTGSGGTFTQAGLREARLLLENSSTADNKNIVLLSDGEPTYSYPIVSVNNKLDEDHFSNMGQSGTRGILIWSPVYDYHARDDLGEAEYNYNGTAGGGSSITTRFETIETGSVWNGSRIYHDYYYHHGNSAIAESRFSKGAGITVYSVGLYADVGQVVLDRVASTDRSFTATEEDLEAIFMEIAGSINKIPAASDSTVIDPLGDMFSIIPEGSPNITVNRGTAVYDPSSRTITWSDFTVREGHPATMSYIVQIHDNALSGVLYPTNRPTYINYTNVLGDPATKDFPIPQAGIEAAGVIVLTKTVQDGDASGKRFPIYVVRKEDGRAWSALLADGETATITGLGVGTYSINEVIPMGYESVSIGPPEVIFTVDNSTAAFNVIVTNKKVGEPWFRDDDEKTNTFKVKASFQ